MKTLPRIAPNQFSTLLTSVGISLTLLSFPLPSQAQVLAPEAEYPNVEQQILTMGTEADYIPFAYRYASDPPSGIVGFDIAIAEAIAQQLDLTLSIHDMDFDQLLPALQSGSLDVAIAAITPTVERQQLVDFSEPYFEASHTLVSPRSHPLTTLADLENQRVAVQTGSLQAHIIEQQIQAGASIDVHSFLYMNDIITAVREGDVDAALVEEMVAQAYLENNPTLELNVLSEIPATPVAIAFPKGSPYVAEFNQVLEDMKTSGELQDLINRWFSTQSF